MKYTVKYLFVAAGVLLAVMAGNAQDATKEVRSMAVFDGRLWAVPASGNGLAYFDGEGWKKSPEVDTPLFGPGVTSLAAVHGRLYAGTGRGLLVKDGSAWSVVALPVSGVIGVSALAADGNALLISTSAGLFRVDAPGNLPKLLLGTGFQAAVGGATGAVVRDVRIFPPPGATTQTVENTTSSVSAASNSEKTPKEAPFWTKIAKPSRPQPKFFTDILPVMVKECLPCHTDGTGKYFPLHDPQTVIRYFKQGGLARFEQFLEEGGGMAGKVSPQTAKLIHVWAVDGCRE